jgi:ketosteroid isomerase-like protein
VTDDAQRFRDMIVAWDARDWDAVAAFYAHDAVLHHPEGWPEAGPTDGRQAIVDEWKLAWQAWGEASTTIRRVADEDGVVVADITLAATGGESGAGFESRLIATCRMRDGLCVEHRVTWADG